VFLVDLVPYCKELLEEGYTHKSRNQTPHLKEYKKTSKKRRSKSEMEEEVKAERVARFDVDKKR
jgi:hypothetical protein